MRFRRIEGWVMVVRRERFIALRVKSGFTQESLAEAMGVDRSTIGRWERGGTSPQPWQMAKLGRLLGVGRDELSTALGTSSATPLTGAAPTEGSRADRNQRPKGDTLHPGSAGATVGDAAMPRMDGGVRVGCRTADGRIIFVTMPRQALAQGVSAISGVTRLSGLAVPEVQAQPPTPTLELHPVESLRSLRRSLVECDNVLGPREVVATAQEHIQLIQQLRRGAAGHDRQALLQVLAEYAEFCSWLHQDGGDHRAAQYWAGRATDWASACGDHDLTAYITARKAQLAGDMKESVDAVDLADYAQRLARPGSRLSAMGAVYGAHGHALLGDELTAQHTFDRALALIAEPSAAPVGRGRWLDAAYVEAQRARSLSLLGRHHEAVAGFEQAIRSLPPNFRRDRGVYLARSAISQVVASGPEQAAATGEAALAVAVTTGSARIFTELVTLDGLLQRCRGVTEVDRFRDALDSRLLHEV
ncbi:helix-turn-helix transcriptional regulator [Kitasatospora sp. McL0602]|uniref:helix-turn-helix transcriptional regulator n=1 Tax=Kitasatospora sp. McL0602 TaxID=3439530 RepID=UPI003F8BFBB5